MKALTLCCPNPFCKHSNDLTALYCGACQTALPRRFLWAVGEKLKELAIGDFIDDRYAKTADGVLLDCYPGLLPSMPKDISLELEAYLKLSSSAPTMPKVYGVVEWKQQELILLEEGAIFPAVSSFADESQAGKVMPSLKEMWVSAHDFRRLSWLYQIVMLWEVLTRFNVEKTLFRADLVRVDGDLVKILEIESAKGEKRSVTELLKVFMDYGTAEPSVLTTQLQDIVTRLIQQPIDNHSYLICKWLDHEMIHYSDGSLVVEVCTLTDQGPNRNRNEDACFPSQKGLFLARFDGTGEVQPLVVVCDGIGGHEGGNVASNLAIETLEQMINSEGSGRSGGDVVEILKAGIRAGNDAICDRNDAEGRTERQRMGTTMVLARVDGRRVHVAHVGDSRVYRITASGCYQLTCDDDVASREVKLGYSLYRDAVGRSGAGALTQAMGMVTSSLLHPTVRSWFVDEDCIFLLCSDGLSDFDRVDESWVQELLPVLDGSVALATACQGLVEIANAQNGHDNVTVGLIYCRVGKELKREQRSSVGRFLSGGRLLIGDRTRPLKATKRRSKTVPTTLSKRGIGRWAGLFVVCGLLGIVAGFVGMRFWPSSEGSLSPELGTESSSGNAEKGRLGEVVPKVGLPSLKEGDVVRVSGELTLLAQPLVPVGQTEEVPGATVGDVSVGTVMRVMERRVAGGDVAIWVRLRVCQVGAVEIPAVKSPAVKASGTKDVGTKDAGVKSSLEGWHVERTVLERLESVGTDSAGGCPVR